MNMETVPAAPKGIMGIIGDIFFSPVTAYESFKQKPNWVIPLILTIVLVSASAGLTYKQSADAQIQMISQSNNPDSPAVQAMIEQSKDPSPMGGMIGAAIMVPVFSLISALLAWLFGSFIFGQKAKYVNVWAVGLLAGLIPLTGGLIRSFMVVAKDSLFVSLGFAALLPGKDFTSILYSICYFLDIFAIWGMIVAGIGYAAIFGLSRAKGMTISIFLVLLGVTLAIGAQVGGLMVAGVEVTFM